MKKKSEPNLDEKLKQEYNRWNYLFTHGGQDPFWADGCNMDLVRNHIIYIKKQMEEAGKLTDTYYRELPPEVDRDYMARADEIRENARMTYKIISNNPDYFFLLENVGRLNKHQIEETCIKNVIGYVTGLKIYIEEDDLVAMRRSEHPESDIEAFMRCRKSIEKILETKPRIIFTEDRKQLSGQINIADWLTV